MNKLDDRIVIHFDNKILTVHFQMSFKNRTAPIQMHGQVPCIRVLSERE